MQIGSSGDYTDHILWRLQNGGVAGAQPKLTVLLIGTNNTGLRGDPPEETAYGTFAILQELKKRLPGSKILLLGIFPRGNTADANKQQMKQLEKSPRPTRRSTKSSKDTPMRRPSSIAISGPSFSRPKAMSIRP